MICAPAAGRPAFRVGARDRNGREHSEDGADDHISEKQAQSLCGEAGEAQSLSAEAVGRICDGDMKPVRIERFPRKSFERTAVIARCGIRHRVAAGAEAKGAMRDDCISGKGEQSL